MTGGTTPGGSLKWGPHEAPLGADGTICCVYPVDLGRKSSPRVQVGFLPGEPDGQAGG